MTKPNLFKRWIAMLLSIVLVLNIYIPVTAVAYSPDNNADRVLDAIQKELEGLYNPDEEVRVSIVLEEKSTLEAGYSTIEIAGNKKAMNYRENLRAKQATVQKAIERKLNKDLDVVWNLTLAANLISANVRRGDIAAIKAVDGVKSVYVERRYLPDVVSVGGTKEPDMAISSEVDGAQSAWDAGYTGEGTLIAIIDTGLDTAHQSFDNDAFLAAVNEDGVADLKLTESDVLALAEKLNATTQKGGKLSSYYRSEKVPFGWSYIDMDDDITHDNDAEGEHGSHVAGIAAANRLIPDGNGGFVDALETVQAVGNAPDAQLLIMKVFGNRGGAYDSDCAAAIEDAIMLGADAVNLSLGMALPGFAFPQGDDPYAELQKVMEDSQTVVVFSAGNAGSWAENTYMGYLYNDGVSYQLGGESGSYTNSFTVASVDNAGFIGGTATANGVKFGWTDGSIGPNFLTLDPKKEGTEYKFIMVEPDAAGNDAAIVAALGDQLKDAIYITWRGSSSFYEKGNAGYNGGAAGVFVANNTSGTISMDLTGYVGNIPVASILQADGLAIYKAGEVAGQAAGFDYITGTITIDGNVGAHASTNGGYTMSDFSSWGTTGDLALKPEISAFGGSIYSVFGSTNTNKYHDQYELMSGTSMAAPQITGMSALVQQYLRAMGYDLNGATARAITQGLLMASATPMKGKDEKGKDYYYSLLQQGAGLANVNNAVNSPVYITVAGQNDGKVKAELGDDPARDGVYVVEFDIHNFTGEAYTYKIDADAFTQKYFEDSGFKLLDYATRDLDADVDVEIDGELFVYVPDLRYDFDNDGDVDDDDAQLLLDFIIKGTELVANAENADVNGDGSVDTYDVHVLLNTMLPEIKVGKDTVHVKVTISLTEEEKELLNEQNPAGAYVEAYVFVQPVADEEGALAPELSIPVLAYYGNWTDASMFEIGTAEEWYNTNSASRPVGGRYPYTFQGAGNSTYNLTMTNLLYKGTAAVSLSKSNVLLNGADAGLDMGTLAYRFSAIRNYGNGVVQVTDNNGNVLWRSADFGASYGLTYYENAGFWVRADMSGSLYYNLYQDVTVDWATAMKNVKEGTSEVTVSLILAPEYYAQYDYDWDALTDGKPENGELGKGAILSTTLSLDTEAPEIVSYTVNGTNPATRTIEVQLTDNKALKVARLYDESGNSQNFTRTVRNTGYESKNASGTAATVTFNGGDQGNTTGYLYDSIYRLEVEDTSGNVTTLRFEVGDVKFTDVPTSVTPSATSIEVLKGSTYALSAVVGPYNLADDAQGVTWSSKNPDIATVDENGVVTAVNKGTATIVVSTVNPGEDGKPVTAEVTVEVFTLPIVATGILGDANGYAKFFTWDFEEGVLDYDKAEESEVVYPLALTPYKTGTFLAIDGDGTIYELDYEGNEIRSSAYAYDGTIPYDMSYSENAGFWWTMSNYILQEPDPFAPDMYGFNMSQYAGTYGNIYTVAVVDKDWEEDGDSGNYLLYALTDKGYMYKFMIDDATGNANISVFPLASLGMDWTYEGYLGDTYGNMVIGSDDAFYISIMRNNTNELYQVILTEVPGSTSFNVSGTYLGNFGDGVWPGLLLTVGNKPTGILYDFNNDGVVDELDAQELLKAVVRNNTTDDMDVNGDGKVTTRDVYDLLVKLESGELNNVKVPNAVKMASIETSVKAKMSKSSLNPRRVVAKNSSDAKVDSTTHTVVVPITASDVNNGLYELTYDSGELTYSSNRTPSGALTHVYNKNTTVRVGFAGLETLAADTVVAEITFTYEGAADDRNVTVTLSVIEKDETVNTTPVTEDIDVLLPGEDIPSYILEGVLTDDSFYAHYFTWDTAEDIEYTNTLPGYPMNPVVAADYSDSEYYIINYDLINEKYDMYLIDKATGKIVESVDTWADPAAEDVVPWDMAYGGDDFYGMWGVYGWYIFTDVAMDEPMADQELAAWNFKDYNQPYFMGIAIADEEWSNSSASGSKVVYAIADDGNVWKLMPYNTATGTSASFQRISYTGLPDLYYDVPWATDDATGTSLVVGADGALYFSCMDADLEASVVYRLTLQGNTYVGEKIAETDYWVYPALLLSADTAEKTPDVPVTPESPVDLTFNGIAQEYDGIYWTEITTKNGAEYKKLHEISNWMDGKPMLTTAAVDLWNETLFAATMEMDDTADFYAVDPKTFNTKLIGTSQFAYTDMADALALNWMSGGNYVVASYGPYVLLVDTTTGQYEGVLWASGGQAANGPEIVGVAFAGLGQYDASTYYDVYYLVDINGDVHLVAFIYIDIGVGPNFYTLSFNNTDDNDVLFSTGYSTDINIYNSLYYVFPSDDTTPGYIVWSCLNYDNDKVDLIVIDEDTNEVYNIGSFDEGVWPVGGLVTLGDATVSVNSVARPDSIASVSKADLGMKIVPVATAEVRPNSVSVDQVSVSINKDAVLVSKDASKPVTMSLKGSVNSIDPKVEDDGNYPKTTITVPVYASASTNGEFILSYDTDVLKLLNSEFGAMLTSCTMDEEGNIHVGYAAKTAVDEIVIEVEFEVLDPDALSTAITLTTIQDGEWKRADQDDTDKDVNVDVELDHVWGEPEFTWNEDGTVTATFTCENNPEHTETVEATVTSAVKTPATETEKGTTTYTATVVFNGETYTATKDVQDIPVVEHVHVWGDPEFTWSEDSKTATATFTCEKDESHTETVKATVTSAVKTPATETEKGTTTYTATVEFNGKSYTATKDVQDIPATGTAKPPKDPQTGDDSNVTFWVSLALISLAGASATLVFARKKIGEDK